MQPAVSGTEGRLTTAIPLTLLARGACPVGRLTGWRGTTALFARRPRNQRRQGLEFEAALRQRFDEHAGTAPEPASTEPPELPRVRELDVADLGAIIWATGFRPDYSWIELPVFDPTGRPLHGAASPSSPGSPSSACTGCTSARRRSSSASARTPSTSAQLAA